MIEVQEPFCSAARRWSKADAQPTAARDRLVTDARDLYGGGLPRVQTKPTGKIRKESRPCREGSIPRRGSSRRYRASSRIWLSIGYHGIRPGGVAVTIYSGIAISSAISSREGVRLTKSSRPWGPYIILALQRRVVRLPQPHFVCLNLM